MSLVESKYGRGLSAFLIFLCCSCLRTSGCDQDPKMCSSLDDFVNNTNRMVARCERDVNCTVVSCTVSDAMISQVILNSRTSFLPCLSPPAISLLFLRPNGSVFSSHLVNQTMEIPLLTTPFSVNGNVITLQLSLHINISHTPPDHLQVETDIIQRILGISSTSVPFNELTNIMLDPYSCEGAEQALTTPTTESTSSGASDTGPTLDRDTTSGCATLSGSAILIIPFLLLTSWILR